MFQEPSQQIFAEAPKQSHDFGEASNASPIDRRPRRLSPEACAADRMLSHAIEYLTDTRALPSGRLEELNAEEPEIESLAVLMQARHRAYLACPVIERRKSRGLLGLFKGPDRRRA